jgi:hypothetical protein
MLTVDAGSIWEGFAWMRFVLLRQSLVHYRGRNAESEN